MPKRTKTDQKWKYGNNCYTSCDETEDKTFATSWDDDHDQRTCEADTPSNRQRYNLLRLGPSTAYKGFRVARDAAIAVKDVAVAAKDKAVYAYNAVAPYAIAAKDRAKQVIDYINTPAEEPEEYSHIDSDGSSYVQPYDDLN